MLGLGIGGSSIEESLLEFQLRRAEAAERELPTPTRRGESAADRDPITGASAAGAADVAEREWRRERIVAGLEERLGTGIRARWSASEAERNETLGALGRLVGGTML